MVLRSHRHNRTTVICTHVLNRGNRVSAVSRELGSADSVSALSIEAGAGLSSVQGPGRMAKNSERGCVSAPRGARKRLTQPGAPKVPIGAVNPNRTATTLQRPYP